MSTGKSALPDAGTRASGSACAEDMALIQEVEAEIRVLHDETVSKGIDAIGDLLLDKFFDGDPARCREGHGSHVSLTVLLGRCQSIGLPVRRTFLSNALQLASFRARMPEAIAARALPPSHRIELLPLKVLTQIEALAKAAVEGRFTVLRLRKAVDDARGLVRKRRPRPLFKLAHDFVARSSDEATGKLAFTAEDFARLSPDAWAQAKAMMRALMGRAGEIDALLGDQPPLCVPAANEDQEGEEDNEGDEDEDERPETDVTSEPEDDTRPDLDEKANLDLDLDEDEDEDEDQEEDRGDDDLIEQGDGSIETVTTVPATASPASSRRRDGRQAPRAKKAAKKPAKAGAEVATTGSTPPKKAPPARKTGGRKARAPRAKAGEDRVPEGKDGTRVDGKAAGHESS